MFKAKFTKKDKRTSLEKEIDEILFAISSCDMTSDEYSKLIENLEKLLKVSEFARKNKPSISPDTIAIIVGNLLGLALILGYEKANIITSKALGFVMKGRV